MIKTDTVLVNDLETRYLEGGSRDNPTIVFVHDGGWGASSDVTWGDVLPLAAENFYVLAVDLLGFGGSAKSVRLDDSPFGFRVLLPPGGRLKRETVFHITTILRVSDH